MRRGTAKSSATGRKPVKPADIWPFLRALHVLSLDLHSSTRQTEAHIKSCSPSSDRPRPRRERRVFVERLWPLRARPDRPRGA